MAIRIWCRLEKTRADLGRVDRLRKGELRRPDLTHKDKETKTIWMCDIAFLQENDIAEKLKEK